jgi:LacI family transcriptional regulator
LRQHPRISAGTRIRVAEIAEQLGYRTNPVISTLMSGLKSPRRGQRTVTLAYLTSYGPEPWHDRVLSGSKERADRLGYRFEEVPFPKNGVTGKDLSEALKRRGISGLVIGPLRKSRGHLRLAWENFACAAIGYTMWKPVPHRVVTHQLHAMRLVVRNLRRRGYRRIGLAIAQGYNERGDRHWTAGYLSEQERFDPSGRIPILLKPEADEASLFEWVRKYRPDAIIGANPLLPQRLSTIGIAVPDDIAYAHLTVFPGDTSFSGVIESFERVGSLAVDVVAEQIQQNERGIPVHPKITLVEATWVDGPTVTNKQSQFVVSVDRLPVSR